MNETLSPEKNEHPYENDTMHKIHKIQKSFVNMFSSTFWIIHCKQSWDIAFISGQCDN